MKKERIVLGVTGRNQHQLREKIDDLDRLGITRAAVFLEFLTKKHRDKVYRRLLKSNIKDIAIQISERTNSYLLDLRGKTFILSKKQIENCAIIRCSAYQYR